MRRRRPELIGIDFARNLRAGAKDLMERAIKAGEKREREAAAYKYNTTQEIAVMVFEQRSNPPLWRMETLTELPHGIGTVKVYDEVPRFLAAELRNVLAGKFELHGVCATPDEARHLACTVRIREMGTVRLKDSERFAGERPS